MSDWKISELAHFTLNVKDVDASVAFYEKFGLEVIHDRRAAIAPAWVAENFELRNFSTRGVIMGVNSASPHVRIDLLQWLDPPLAPPPDVPRDENPASMIAFLVENTKAAVEEISDRGVHFHQVREGKEFEELGLKGVAMCRDPDDNIVELIEYTQGRRLSDTDKFAQRSE